jgi:hypothetical protein
MEGAIKRNDKSCKCLECGTEFEKDIEGGVSKFPVNLALLNMPKVPTPDPMI